MSGAFGAFFWTTLVLYALAVAAKVCVKVNKAGQQVMAFQFQDSVTLFCFRPSLVLYRHSRVAHVPDRLDPVALDHDVHGTDRRGAFAVDNSHAAKNQALEWPFATHPVTNLVIGGFFVFFSLVVGMAMLLVGWQVLGRS